MDYVNSVWQVGIIALVAGALIGALAYRLFAPAMKQVDKARQELIDTRNELIAYRASVGEHFDKTSELVNDLTQNYVKVYRHLAEGAQTLGNSPDLTNLLEQQQGKVLLSVNDAAATASAAVGETADSGAAGYAPDATTADTPESVAADDAIAASAPPATASAGEDEPTGPSAEGNARSPSEMADAAKESDAAPERESGLGQPVLDVSRLDQAAGKTGASATIATDESVREAGDRPQNRPVTH